MGLQQSLDRGCSGRKSAGAERSNGRRRSHGNYLHATSAVHHRIDIRKSENKAHLSLAFYSINSQCVSRSLSTFYLMLQAQLPVLTLPFVTATSLFLKLSNGREDPTFPWPVSITSPEKQRHHYLARRAAFREVRFSRFHIALSGRLFLLLPSRP